MNVSQLKSAEGGAVITHSNITDRKLAEIAYSGEGERNSGRKPNGIPVRR